MNTHFLSKLKTQNFLYNKVNCEMSQVKVLIAEDDHSVGDLISKYLKKHGYLVQLVDDGDKCVEIFNTFLPHILILDVMLPGLDGYQVCKRVR
ncbi:MAG: response regulator, partial [Leptospiraceae bacterium]|nr:response regulator [Leptospiraceae bacterium]